MYTVCDTKILQYHVLGIPLSITRETATYMYKLLIQICRVINNNKFIYYIMLD